MKIRWIDRDLVPPATCFLCDSKESSFSFKYLEFTQLTETRIIGTSKKMCNGCLAEYKHLISPQNRIINKREEKQLNKILGSV